MWNSNGEPFKRSISYIDNDGEIDDDKYQEALEAIWDKEEQSDEERNS